MGSSTVISDLARWGPGCEFSTPDLPQAQAYCRQLAWGHYENFPVLSWALPRHLRQHFANVYAFCRWADDLGDEAGGPEKSLPLLAWWRSELDRCYDGHATHPVFVALRQTIKQFSLPREPFADLISAFEQDQRITSYDTFNQLLDYCSRSANPVGRIVLRLCDRFYDQNVVWSDSICTGLQLANFWQDVSRDYHIGRVYLPRDHREQFGYSPDDLRERRTNAAFLDLMRSEVHIAREMLLAGRPLVNQMPGRLRVDIDLFLQGGLLILREIDRIDYRVWDKRPVVHKSHFLWAGMKSLLRLS